MPRYDVALTATISIRSEVEAPDAATARDMVKLELRSHGDITEPEVERCIWLHEEDLEGAATREWGGA